MFIYKITNKINNKVYIGQTIKDIHIRFKQHCQKSNKHIGLSIAIQKYGKNNFTVEEIDGANSQSELNYKEWLLINKYNSLAPNGYNLMHGGGSKGRMGEIAKKKLSKSLKGRISPNKGKQLTEKHKKALSESHMGQKAWNRGLSHTVGTKIKISKAKLGQSNTMKGKKHTAQSCRNMSNGSVGQKGGMLNKYHSQKSNIKNAISNGGKAFYMKNKEDNIVWSGIIISECARKFNLSVGNVSECLRGKRKTHKGFKFMYSEYNNGQ